MLDRVALINERKELRKRIREINSILVSHTEEHIVEVVEELLCINNLMKRTRKQEYVYARDIVMYYAVENLGYTPHKAGAIVGRDHATCILAVKKVKDYLSEDSVNKGYREIHNMTVEILEDIENEMDNYNSVDNKLNSNEYEGVNQEDSLPLQSVESIAS